VFIWFWTLGRHHNLQISSIHEWQLWMICHIFPDEGTNQTNSWRNTSLWLYRLQTIKSIRRLTYKVRQKTNIHVSVTTNQWWHTIRVSRRVKIHRLLGICPCVKLLNMVQPLTSNEIKDMVQPLTSNEIKERDDVFTINMVQPLARQCQVNIISFSP
jgi:hypothetical protein